MNTPTIEEPAFVDVRQVIFAALAPGLSASYRNDATEAILAALSAAGVEVMAPQDITWGTCPESSTGRHEVALGLCSGCLQYDPE